MLKYKVFISISLIVFLFPEDWLFQIIQMYEESRKDRQMQASVMAILIAHLLSVYENLARTGYSMRQLCS